MAYLWSQWHSSTMRNFDVDSSEKPCGQVARSARRRWGSRQPPIWVQAHRLPPGVALRGVLLTEEHRVHGHLATTLGGLGQRLVVGQDPRPQVAGQPVPFDDGVGGD